MGVDVSRYPMADPSGGPFFSLSDFAVLLRRIRTRIFGGTPDIADNLKDRKLPFTEYPDCESCGSNLCQEVLTAMDGNRIVECSNCGIWYASPRVPEGEWRSWLTGEAERNIQVTENRLKHGYALDRNVPHAFSFWWRRRRKLNQRKIGKLIKTLGGTGELRLHDVGCGVGFLLKAAHDLGIQCSGNDLNGYAVKRMRELFNLDVHLGTLPELFESGVFEAGSYDIITMDDFIEHSYHPLRDLEAAFSMLRVGGIISVGTFCVDSDPFRRMGRNWDMLMWNHTFQFSSNSLRKLVEQAGFDVAEVEVNSPLGIVRIIGRKR
jgi:2-polyprenyl-3-methyl-5-hydroxy-6-metoxy-1,4-benzoquinol methylase